jgi:hypothetical protein
MGGLAESAVLDFTHIGILLPALVAPNHYDVYVALSGLLDQSVTGLV